MRMMDAFRQRRLVAGMTIVALIAGVAGCSNSDAGAGTDSASISDQSARSGGAERAVLENWRLYQTSNWPSLASHYDQMVLHKLGSYDIVNALAISAGTLQHAPIRNVDTSTTTLGTSVTLELVDKGEPTDVSYLVRRRGSAWKIMYDTQLDNALPTYVQAEIASRTGRVGEPPTQSAVRAGNEAARIYREIFAPKPRGSRVLNEVLSGG